MAFELQENRVMIFANKDTKNPKAPAVTGKVNAEGSLIKIAGWKSKEGGGAITGKLSVANNGVYNVVGGLEFKVTEKTKDNSPDKTGTLTVGNKEYRLALWKKTSANGLTEYLSGTIQDPDKAHKVTSNVTKSAPKAQIEDDIF